MTDTPIPYEEPTFTVDITLDVSVEMTVAEVWPDGCPHTFPTADDVRDEMENYCGSASQAATKKKVLWDWNLLDDRYQDFHVTVSDGEETVKVWK